MNLAEINNEIGDIDIFLLDLVLKGKLKQEMKILDAGCGSGRNLFYFLKQGFDVIGIDSHESEVIAANFLSRSLGRGEVCSQAIITEISFENNSFDFIVCSRVLHFAESQSEFESMLAQLARVLQTNGLLYLSMDSMIGMESKVMKMDNEKFQFPDGSVRFMLSESILSDIEMDWNHEFHPRTINFNNEHSETVLILRKK